MTKGLLSLRFKKGVINQDWIQSNIDQVLEVYNVTNKFNHSNNIMSEFISLCLTIKKTKYIKYIDEVEDFDIERFKQYLEYREINKSESSSERFFKLKYGSKWLEFKNAKSARRSNMYDPKYIAKRDNISLDEAKKQIDKFKSYKATSKDGFIKRHGKERGIEMFKEFQKTSNNHDLDNLIRIHGNESIAIQKLSEYNENNRRNSKMCIEHWESKGYSLEEAQDLVKDWQHSNAGVSYSSILRRYDYDESKAQEVYSIINKKKDGSSLEFFIKKCNGDISQAKHLYEESCKRKDCVSIKGFLSRGYNYSDAIELHSEAVEKRTTHLGKASKMSMSVFKPILNYINEYVYIGYETSNEYFLYDSHNNKINFYDFTIINDNIKLIIEYNGEAFHPNIEKLSKKQLNEWKSPYSKQSWQEIHSKDKYKQNLAKQNGFEYLTLWSSDSVDDNINKCIEFLNKNGIKINEN